MGHVFQNVLFIAFLSLRKVIDCKSYNNMNGIRGVFLKIKTYYFKIKV